MSKFYWKIKVSMRKQDQPKSSLWIHNSRLRETMEFYPCNEWGIGYWKRIGKKRK
jgi:hypothetical protein